MATKIDIVRVRRSGTDRRTEQQRDIAGTRVGIRVQWLAQRSRWAMWLLSLDASLIAGPILLVPGIDLLAGLRHDPRVPQVEMFVWSQDLAPPDLDTIDGDAKIYFRAL